MADATAMMDGLYFRCLELENVRAFGGLQRLNLTDALGRPCMWNLILGENGVGKTTILQALARMRPVPAFSRQASPRDTGEDAGAPGWTEPEISQHENEEISSFVRMHDGVLTMRIDATLEASPDQLIEIGITAASGAAGLASVDFTQDRHELNADGPLVIGYGAARHVGHGNAAVVAERDPTDPLFSEAIDLFDAEEILGLMHYAALSGGKRDEARMKAVTTAVADLIPDMTAADIQVRGPHVPGRPASEAGVHVSVFRRATLTP